MVEFTPFEIDADLRLLAATICGLIVGFNRDIKQNRLACARSGSSASALVSCRSLGFKRT